MKSFRDFFRGAFEESVGTGTHQHGSALDLTNNKENEVTTATTTHEYKYTDDWDGYSSAVDYAAYDEPTRTLYIEVVGGDTYAYKNVDKNTWEDFLSSPSKGSFYAVTIKRSFGPGDYLGYEASEELEERGVEAADMGPVVPGFRPTAGSLGLTGAVGTPKDLKLAEGATVTNVTRTFNLQAPLLDNTVLKHTVRFTVDGGTDVKSYSTNANSVTEAVAAVNEIGDSLGLEFNVKEVCVHFE